MVVGDEDVGEFRLEIGGLLLQVAYLLFLQPHLLLCLPEFQLELPPFPLKLCYLLLVLLCCPIGFAILLLPLGCSSVVFLGLQLEGGDFPLQFGVFLLQLVDSAVALFQLVGDFLLLVAVLAVFEDEFVVLGLQLFVAVFPLLADPFAFAKLACQTAVVSQQLLAPVFQFAYLSVLVSPLLLPHLHRHPEFAEGLLEFSLPLSLFALLPAHGLPLPLCELELVLHLEEFDLVPGVEGAFGVAEVLALDVDFVAHLQHLLELLLVLLPQVLVPFLLPQQHFDQVGVGPFVVEERPFSLLDQLLTQQQFAEFGSVDLLGELPLLLLLREQRRD